MKRPLASLVAIVLVVICGAPMAGAIDPPAKPRDGGGPDRHRSYSNTEIVPRAQSEFKELRDDVTGKYNNASDFIPYIDATEKRFVERAGKSLPEDRRYNNFEVEYLSGLFDKVILPQLKKTLNIIADPKLAPEEAHAKVAAVAMPMMVQALKTYDVDFVSDDKRKRAYSQFIAVANGDSSNVIAQDLHSAAHANPGGSRGNPKGILKNPDRTAESSDETPERPERIPPTLEEMIARSPVVKLGVDSANYSVNPKPDPEPVAKPEPGQGGSSPRPRPSFPQGGDQSGSSPTDGATPNDIINSIASNGGTLMANRGADALQRGDYAAALRMAQTALRYEPDNKNAMAVLYSVKGRGDAKEAGDASLLIAKGGASAFGAPGFAGGPGGASSPSSEIAAAALSGAAKVASDEARAGATNALKLGDPQGALGILSKALAENPNNPALLNLRAQTYGRLGRWDDALKDAVSGLALAPGNMVLLNTKALSENRTRRWRDALATADMMIAADPKNAWAYANRAHAWGGLGDRDAMLADINRAAALDPRFQKAAADAALTQIPSDSDVMFLFPGESAKGALKAPVPAGRGKSFSVVVGAGIVGGLLLALGLLSTVLAPLKDTVVSAFTRVKRAAPATNTAVATAQPASVAGNVGGLIRGQYEISRQIGAGGMGMVYEGTDRSLGRRVAIKKMRDELRLNARERDRFIIEAKTVASLHHPNIVDIYAIAEEGEDVYLVFEYVDGKTVHDLVQTAGRLAPAESVRVTRAMGEALTYAHAHGVIHRDMKPSNVMMTAAGQVKVMDFGIARMAKDAMTRYSMTNTVVGTPPYMAPEQEQGVVRKESDVYSLAICAYEMLTGKLPFIGMGAGMLMNKINMSYIPPSRNIAGLPEALDEVFLKAFQADPDRRYRTPQEFVAALSAAADGARSKTG